MAIYRQRRADGSIAERELAFRVREASRIELGFFPPDPVALEPVEVEFFRNVCDLPQRVEPVDGGFRVVMSRNTTNEFGCDYDFKQRVTLGAFAPGAYRVAVGRVRPGGPFEEIDAQPLVVAPGPSEWTQRGSHNNLNDLSGLWWSPGDAPNTGLYIVHSRSGPPRLSDQQESLTAFWYTYDASGAPAWYVIPAARGPAASWIGEIRRFGASNPLANPADVVTTARAEGTAELEFHRGDRGATFRVTRGTTTQSFRIERFRWVHGGWKE